VPRRLGQPAAPRPGQPSWCARPPTAGEALMPAAP
jgi:hypothetical protein